MLKKDELLQYIGNQAQSGSTRHYVLTGGWADNLRCIDVNSGNGLQYTVVPDRGMDISLASYRGINLVYITSNGETNPAFYDPVKFGWLRTFAGGLLTTCGLTYLGSPVNDEGEELGLHGRYSTIPAKNVSDLSEWIGDEYHIKLRGTIEEGHVFGHKLRLVREITTIAGQNNLRITDTVTNFGFKPAPYTILYHMNFGFPLLDENSQLDISNCETIPRDNEAASGLKDSKRFTKPQPGFSEQVFIHKMAETKDHYASATLKNPGLGIGMTIRFDVTTLPYLIQWKMMGQGEYVLGLEPSNVPLRNRKELRDENLQPWLKPGETIVNSIEISLKNI
jgi:galactose mutarotase-like enzyme